MRSLRLVLVALALGAPLAAQLGRDREAELQRLRRIKDGKAGEIQQLVDRRFRLDLGLPLEEDASMPLSAPISTVEKERRIRELREAEGETQVYMSRFNEMKRALEELRADVEARRTAREREENFVVPSAGSMQRSQGTVPPTEAVESRPQGQSGGAAEAGTETAPPDLAVQLDRVRGRIRGSQDHLQVAQSLFKAGQARMDYAANLRERGAVEPAVEEDRLGKERLERALAELQPLLEAKEPEYAALFCKGRCLELLFRYSTRYEGLSLQRSTRNYQQREQQVREPFLAISARDVTKAGAKGELEILGSWGKAAQAAVEHFRWMNLHGEYAPPTSIESITWPGEKGT